MVLKIEALLKDAHTVNSFTSSSSQASKAANTAKHYMAEHQQCAKP